ncbi:MAG: hypothetical protein KIS87_02540 [Phycisphaeraceae bacterium]|nr:hypothetical protein [Phycisphaeraceae bacterium]
MSHTSALDPEPVRHLLDGHDFVALFREHLGWDRHDHAIDIPIGTHTFRLGAVAEKRNFAVYLCSPDARGRVPDRATRDAIERVLAKSAHEHLMIFADKDRRHQVWMWVRRVPGKPASQQTYEWFKGQRTGQILQRVLPTLAIAFEDDDATTLPDVRARVAAAFDVEKVTKKFFERFQKEHAAFHKFIEGIKVAADRDWYASVMLNRLMFCYFIQKKGLLDGDTDYLRNRLTKLQATKGKDKFWTFYQHFLLRLFHEGLSTKPGQRSKDLDALIGRIPYLNGGLFDIHEIEERYDGIQIPDTAFEKLFKFFDEYRWHLDERPLRENNEINPDVLGYIFEKYINQKQMGAYYTKEDITGYISQNTIIPYILDQAAAACTIAFVPPGAPNSGGSVWRLLQNEPDRYIYEPVRRGVIDDGGNVIPLPPEIETGITDVSKRGGWNKPATAPFGLPTETWREHVARRERCVDLRRKLAAGEVSTVNDLVTLNLDVRQFAADVIERCEGPDLLRAMWKAVESVTVLDPTCGSGAFLFAALNVLEPLYEACLDRMGGFLDTLARDAAAAAEGKGRAPAPDTFADFSRILDRVAAHPNHRYFILKSIIVSNLYGVDIMEEASEICKLRLFLKMVAQVEEGAIEKIEPLPDIDFNIRAGNTLVGFASLAAVRKSMEGRIDFGDSVARIERQASAAADRFATFRAMQTSLSTDSRALATAKTEVRAALRALHAELDEYLASEYGVDPTKAGPFSRWRRSHLPFHWLVDFYSIISTGGFDVVIGNPPYVEYSKVRDEYRILGFATESCGNLYAPCSERAYQLLRPSGRFGFIVQAPVVSTQRMRPARDLILARSDMVAIATFDDRPSKLFDGMHHCRLAILLARVSASGTSDTVHASRYYKWYAEERSHLFATLGYHAVPAAMCRDFVPKVRSGMELEILRRLSTARTSVGNLLSPSATEHTIYYKITGVGHWFTFTLNAPRFWRDGAEGSSTRENAAHFRTAAQRDAAFCTLMSTLHYWAYQMRTNCRDFNPADLAFPPIADRMAEGSAQLSRLAQELSRDLTATAEVATATYKVGGTVSFEKFRPKRTKHVIDRIDGLLGASLGLADEQIDFIVNYDIKYRIGDAQEEEGNDS